MIPYFSIIIPTFNRAKELAQAINIIKNQSFQDFEIIIVDNASTDNTMIYIQKVKDKKIKYFRNKKNIGWINNLQVGITNSSGEYILLHGDDDMLISNRILENLYHEIKTKKYGYIRLNYLSNRNGKIFKFGKRIDVNFSISPRSANNKIITFIQDFDPYFLTGIIFRNKLSKKGKIIDSELVPWFEYIFHATKEKGAIFIAKPFFVACWADKSTHPFYVLKNNKFTFENYLASVKKILKSTEYKKFLKNELDKVVHMLPLNKYNTNINNMKKCAKRLRELYPTYRFSPIFMTYFALSFLPNTFIKVIKDIRLKIMVYSQ